MSEPCTGEIRRFPYLDIPENWLPCNGQVFPTTRYPTLYQLIANTYGGDASANTFALPNLQGSVAVSAGGNAGALGASEFNPGPQQPFQTVVFAICVEGFYPPIG